jgi:hypothetical protein
MPSNGALSQRNAIELRLAQPDEGRAIRRLAALDDAPELEGEILLALIDGDAIAALSLHDQRVVANPFLHTRDVVALLRLRAEHMRPRRVRRRLRRVPSLRLA